MAVEYLFQRKHILPFLTMAVKKFLNGNSQIGGSNLEMVVGWLNIHFNSKIKLNISFQAFVVFSIIWKAKYYRVGML